MNMLDVIFIALISFALGAVFMFLVIAHCNKRAQL